MVHVYKNIITSEAGGGKSHNGVLSKLFALLLCCVMLFYGTPVTSRAEYNYDAYIATSYGDRIRGLTIADNDSFTLDVAGNDAGVDYGWSTSDSSVVAVNTSGGITPKKVGEATIYLRLNSDWNTVLDSIKVTVLAAGSEGLRTRTELTIDAPDEGHELPSFSLFTGDVVNMVAFDNGDDNDVVTNAAWSSSDETVATVVNGKVTAKGVGKTTIIAKATLKVAKTDEDGNEVTDDDGELIYEDKECTATLVVTVLETPKPEEEPQNQPAPVSTPEPSPQEEPQNQPAPVSTPEPSPQEEPQNTGNPKTGDLLAQMALVGYSSTLVLALGAMLSLIKKRKSEV